MAASSGFMIAEAERRFPVRIRVGVPPDGLGSRLDRIKAWLDENCGAKRLGDDAFGHSRCAGGVFQVREDEPMPRVGAMLDRTP